MSPSKAAATPRWLAKYPELGDGPISTTPYISPEWYAKEKQKIFSKVWLCVGLEREIPNAGDYKVKRLHCADTSIILVRGKDGRVRAFHNMCSHRGNTVVTEKGEETFGRSKAAVMTCRFHGWVYDATGALVSVPSEDRFYSCFEKSANGLTGVHYDSWQGFMFVNVDPGPVQPLLEFLGGYATHFAGYPFERMDFGFTYRTYLDCNWKIASDAFAEAYHVDTIHAGSFPNAFSGGIEDVQLLGPHRTSGVCLNIAGMTPTPLAALANKLARGSLVARAGSTSLPPTINPSRRPDFAFELSVLFPTLLLHVAEGIWFTHQFWPISHDRTLWEGKYYVAAPRTHSERWAVEHAMTLQRNAWLEDTATMEDTHRAMLSRAKQVQHLQDDEILIRHGARVVEQYVNGEAAG